MSPVMSPLPSLPLLDALRAGDPDAFAGLIAAQSPLMLRLAVGCTGSTAAATRAVSAAWTAFLDDVCRGTAVEEAAVRVRLLRLVLARVRTGPRAMAPAAPRAASLAARLRAGLAALPDAEREAITLRDVCGLGPAEACAVLGIGPGRHRELLHRGRTQMHARLSCRVGA